LCPEPDSSPSGPAPGFLDRAALRGDCANCFGLCCVALPFAASADFAVTKAAGQPCVNLTTDFRCGIHARLREQGFAGCTIFDCFGAGQRVSQATFGGMDWRNPRVARRMFEVFVVMRRLHELLWYVAEALTLPAARPLHQELRRALVEIEQLARGDADSLIGLDVAALRQRINPLLLRTSELVRARASHSGSPGKRPKSYRGADLAGARLAGADLRGADLRGACLIAADLTGADLRMADLIGADLRDAKLNGADLTDVLFLTQPQLDAAVGDATTRIPHALERPAHWPRVPSPVAQTAQRTAVSGASPDRLTRSGRPAHDHPAARSRRRSSPGETPPTS